MSKKIITLSLVITLFLNIFIINGNAKEIDSLAEISALSKLEPIGTSDSFNAYTELSPVQAQSLPASYSSRDLGHTTDVRQQHANICWAFSSLASFETLLLKSGETVEHLSPQHMNIWGTVASDGTGWQRQDLINDGGYSYIPMGYLTSWGGPLLENEFPESSDTIDYDVANAIFSPQYGVTGIKYVDPNTPIDTVKSYVMEYGSVVANFNADTVKYMNADTDAFYCADPNITTGQLYGHAVSLVGWDDNYSKENFSTSYSGDTPDNDGAWLVKNSWGTSINSNDGYFWISYEDAWLFNSIFGPSFAITEYEKLDGTQKIYQNEIHGATTQFPYLTNEDYNPTNTVTYMNVFDFTEDYNVLDKVVFESDSFGAEYTVYYIPVFDGIPTDETHIWTKLGSGTIDYTGYIPVDINDYQLPEGEGAIGITIDNTDTYNENKDTPGYEYIPNSIGVCEWLAYVGGYYYKNQGEYGDSFIMWEANGKTEFCDIMEFYDARLSDTMGGTPVIKAITKVTDSDTPAVTIPEPTTSVTTTAATDATEATEANVLYLHVDITDKGVDRISVTASASGGTGPYTYKFSINNVIVQSYSSDSSYVLAPEADGAYTIEVSVKDSNGTVLFVSKDIEIVDGNLSGSTDTTVSDDPFENPGTNATDTAASDSADTTAATEATSQGSQTDSTSASTASTDPSSPNQHSRTYIIGDVDNSGHISVKDATLIRKYLAKLAIFDSFTERLADVNDSGDCSIADATLIQKYAALIETDSNVGDLIIVHY